MIIFQIIKINLYMVLCLYGRVVRTVAANSQNRIGSKSREFKDLTPAEIEFQYS